jgi:small acid-soluble spore protein I
MDLNLRKAIMQNMSGNNEDQIRHTIEDAIESGEEKMLPGLGVLFELAWKKTSQEEQEQLLAWRGAHTWVMTGYRADADPSIFPDATVSGAYILDPWYPRVSQTWGPGVKPHSRLSIAQLGKDWVEWRRSANRPGLTGRWAMVGGLLGFLLAYGGTRILVALGPAAIPRLDEIHTSTNVLLFTSAVVVGAALLVALVPAVRVAAGRSIHALRDGGRSATVGRDRHRVRKGLVILQVALTLVVLVGSGLMVRSFQQLRAVDPGFRPEGIATFGLFPPPSRYPDSESSARFLDRLLEQLESLPGLL